MTGISLSEILLWYRSFYAYKSHLQNMIYFQIILYGDYNIMKQMMADILIVQLNNVTAFLGNVKIIYRCFAMLLMHSPYIDDR